MPVPKGESAYIYGLHDRGGEDLLLVNGQARGWVLVTEKIQANPNDQSGGNYKDLADQNLGVIARLNHAYGSDGTIPHPSKYRDFAQRAANFVKNSSGAHIWLIGNEMNLEREQPRRPGSNQAEPITPRNYAECYRLCREAIHRLSGHENDQVVVGAIGPWNAETHYDADPQGRYPANKIPDGPQVYPYNGFWGDFIKYFQHLLLAIGLENCDAIAIHAYSHGYDPALVFSNEKMSSPPEFRNYFYNFRTYRDQMNAIPSQFRHLPVYLTEANGDANPDGSKWPDKNSGWIKNAYQEINNWNQAGNQQIRCMILYRWSRDDDWHIDGKLGVQKDFREAIAMNNQWDPSIGAGMATTQYDYRTRYLNHNTPNAVPPGQTLTVSLTLQNAGKLKWDSGGNNPFRLGFQWYDTSGQMVAFPPDLNFHTSLPSDVPSGGTVTLSARLRTPDTAGTYHLRWDMIHENVTWFTTQGDAGLLISPVTVKPGVEIAPTVPATTVQIQDVSANLAKSSTSQYPRRSRSAIRRIILHHTATPANVSVERIAEYQVNTQGRPGIAYHYCLTNQGVIYQTQPLEVVSAHAGKFSDDSVGVCLIGNFTSAPPPQTQLDATAALLAKLATELGISVDQIFGYSDLVTTGSPGATWPTWKGPLLDKVRSLMTSGVSVTPTPTPTPTAKPIEHYMLLWHHGAGNWAEWDLRGAIDYIAKFPVTVGFSIEEAKWAKYVTIIGGTKGGVPAEAEQILRAAGCQVERLAGATETETRRMLEELATQGRRFRTLQ